MHFRQQPAVSPEVVDAAMSRAHHLRSRALREGFAALIPGPFRRKG